MVDGGGLENHCTRKGTGGSNPSPSATLRSRTTRRVRTMGQHRDDQSTATLRLDVITAKLLVWVASVGRDADLTPEAHVLL